MEALVNELRQAMEPTTRFPDLELLETADPLVYFDQRTEEGVPYASPIQCWLELQAGDKREREASNQVRELVLSECDPGSRRSEP
jgi:hypothetical protein